MPKNQAAQSAPEIISDRRLPNDDLNSKINIGETAMPTAEGCTIQTNTDKEMFPNYPEIVSVNDIMNMLHIGRGTAYSLLRNNQIKHIRIGKKYVIPKNSVIGFLNSSCYNGFVVASLPS